MFWYKNSQIRNLVDMHIPNGEGYLEKFDSAKYAENVKKSGATTAYLYSCNCLGLCFYPTKVGLRHKAADRDIFGQTVDECRKRGLKVVGYTNTWATFVVDKHPEWSVVYADGSRRRDKLRFGTPCVGNDEYVDYVCAHVRELVSSYKLDGLWMDMVGISAPVCFCESCKKKFRAEFGRDMPTTIEPDSTEFFDYLGFKERTVSRYLKAVRDAAKETDPDITVAFQSAGAVKHPLSYATRGVFEYSDYLSGDFYTERAGVNVTCRMLQKATNTLPFEFMTSRCVSLERHTMNKNINELILQSYAALMYKGAFLFIDAIDPDGEMNSEFYDDIAVISREMEKYIPYIDYEEEPIRKVGVYFNIESDIPYSEEDLPLESLRWNHKYRTLKKIDKVLSEAHIDYDILSEKDIDSLGEYKTIILSAVAALGDDEIERIKDYVKNGGNLYVSGTTSMRELSGKHRDNFGLSELLGVDFCGHFRVKPAYLAPVSEDRTLFGKHTRKYPHMLEENIVKVKQSGDGRVLATVTLPVGDVSDNIVFSSAISDPPINYTDHPAIFEREYGKGRVIYSAGYIEYDQFPDSADLFVALIDRLTGERRVNVTAPTCVDYTAYEKESRITLHFLNSQTVYPPIPIADITVSVDVGERKIKSVNDITGGRCEYTLDGGKLVIHTDLSMYKFIMIELE